MKKILLFALGFVSSILTGCFETTQQLTIKENGSGDISSKIDVSNALAMLIQMGGAGKDRLVYDTTVSFNSFLDSVEGLTEREKTLLKDGTIHVIINTDDEKMIFTTGIPFKSLEELNLLKEVMEKWDQSGGMNKVVSGAFGEAPGMGDMGIDSAKNGGSNPFASVAESYFTVSYRNGKISRSLIKEKYAKLNEDESLSKIKEVSEMGMPVKSNFVINLPKPVKHYTGKNVKISDDKKKVTVENTLDELFDDPSKYEFTIEY